MMICVPTAILLGFLYYVLYLFSWVGPRNLHGSLWVIGFSSVNIGFGVGLFLALLGQKDLASKMVDTDAIGLFLGGYAMLITALKELSRVFGMAKLIARMRG